MTLACVSLILGGNTETLWRYEHLRVPLSWVTGACAILAFLAFEYIESGSPAVSEAAFPEFSTESIPQEPELQ